MTVPLIPKRLNELLQKAFLRQPLDKDDCLYLLNIDEYSYESSLIRGAANELIRQKQDNAAIIVGQIGVDIHPCDADCKFCSFGKNHTGITSMRADEAAIKAGIDDLCRENDLFGIYLMTMADTDKDYLLKTVELARSHAPASTQIWVNTGDNDLEFYKELKAAGAVAAYHVCRLREGTDTCLSPRQRIASICSIREAGLEPLSCCEPIGPEHTAEELADNIMLCTDKGVTQFGAMRRIAVPGSPLEKYGQISDLRMAHIMGVVGLVYASVESIKYFGVHEPCQLGYVSGANFITAEIGANPRDTACDTTKGRGWDMARCRKLLWECGFTRLNRGDGSSVTLDRDYLLKTGSLR